MSEVRTRADEAPPYRYNARLANEIEERWQDRWEEERTFWTPNPTGPLADGYERVADRSKLYVLDMFPYPSGAGLHVGHPLGYIGTDVYARFQRMTGHNVLHAMGYDAFGLPAEQYALETGQHPRVTTDQNIATMRRQLRRLGLGHDPRRGVSTTEAVDASHHQVRRTAAGRSRPARLARVDQDHAAQLDRAQRGRRHHVPGRGSRRPRHPCVHAPPRHRVRRHLHGAGAGARRRRRDRRQRMAP